MKYTDKYLTNKLYRAYKSGTNSNQPRGAIVKYWKEIVELSLAGKINRETACYHICSAIIVPIVENDPILENIASDAGELELPKQHISGNAESRWKKLQQVIKALD